MFFLKQYLITFMFIEVWVIPSEAAPTTKQKVLMGKDFVDLE